MTQTNEQPLDLAVKAQPLSDRQTGILQFIRDYFRQHGHAPSIRDIGRGVGISSNSNVVYHINRLIQYGYLYKQPGTSRTLVVLMDYQPIDDPVARDLVEEMAELRAENRRLREWCRQLERERAWERKQVASALAG